MPHKNPKNVITIATGKKLYVDLAVNLARSFYLWNTHNDIKFYIVTDLPNEIPDDVTKFCSITVIDDAQFGKGFTPKLYLDHLAPFGQTLFIDSDCLVYGDLSIIFEKFAGNQVSVIGNYISNGEWFGDVISICEQFGIPRLPKFNGGVYYLENGETARAVYSKARELEDQYDKIGFVRLRGRPNDEVLMALAMQLFLQKPIPDDGSLMAEFVSFPSKIYSNLIAGKAILYNMQQYKHYNKTVKLTEAKPLIVHFLGHYNALYPYTKEVKILQLLAKGYSKSLAKLVAQGSITLPFNIKELLKLLFRPIYRTLFGYRKVAKSERIIE